MPQHVIRLRPGDDLRAELMALAVARDLRAAWIVTCVGSLTDVHLRYANREGGTRLSGHFEIVSLVGTLAASGAHLHMSVSDGEGRVVGGHLLEAGNRVYTTAEIVVGFDPGLAFGREVDSTFGYRELVVRERG